MYDERDERHLKMDRELLRRILLLTVGGERDVSAMASRQECTAILDKLYSFLNVLDSKANGLLRIAGVFIGLIGLGGFISANTSDTTLPLRIKVFLALSMAGFIWSTLECLFIVRMKWHFFERIDVEGDAYRAYAQAPVATGRAATFGAVVGPEITALIRVTVDRTEHYNRAWGAVMFGFLAFFAAFALLVLTEI